MGAEPGDKIRLKVGTNRGERGVVESVHAKCLHVRLKSSGDLLKVSASDVTNYSLAARRAWERMPDRRVGRPRGSRTTDRVSVTLRIDREVWERFKHAEQTQLIKDRTAMINAWLAEKLTELGH